MSRSMTAAQFQALGARSLADITPERIAALKEMPDGPKSASLAQRARGLTQHNRSDMNKTEARYAAHLEVLKRAGEVLDYRFQAINFRLADNTWHRPDFWVLPASGYIEIREIKGTKAGRPHWTQDGWKTFKIAREHWSMFRWRLIYFDQGEWKEWQPKD